MTTIVIEEPENIIVVDETNVAITVENTQTHILVEDGLTNVYVSQLQDVTITNPLTGEGLIYNEATEVWENGNIVAIWGAITGTLSDQTDLQTELNDKLENVVEDTTPQLGGDLDSQGYQFTSVGNIEFDLTPDDTAYEVGKLVWNSDEGTLDLGMPNSVTQQIGQEVFFYIKNQSGSTLTNGQAVMFDGAVGASGRLKAKPAIADGTYPAVYVMGIVTHDILNGEDGYITFFGKVRGIDTTGTAYGETWADGDILYVSPTTAGALTNVKPEAPDLQITIAAVVYAHATSGTLFVRPTYNSKLQDLDDVDGTALTTSGQIPVWNNTASYFDFDYNINDYVPYTVLTDDKNPTGWLDGNNITVSYNFTNKTITLTHASNLYYYWRGVKYELGTAGSWTSDPHTTTTGPWFLYTTDGTNFIWSNTAWEFDDVMVAYVYYSGTATTSFALRETHGLMDWEVHRELHEILGTYRLSGGTVTVGTYTENTASDDATTIGFDEAVIKDEDALTTIPAWLQGTYTTMYVGASNTSVFDTTATFPFISDGSYLKINNTTTGVLSDGINNRYYNIYQILLPTASDTDSQKYRTILLQPQNAYTTLAGAQAEDPRSLNYGSLASLSPEFTIHARITYTTLAGYSNTGKCAIATNGITYVTGSKANAVTISNYVPTDHENLTGLQGGTTGEHYHLTLEQIGALITVSATAPESPSLNQLWYDIS